MDPLTHGLASYALKRGLFPRTPFLTTIVILTSGIVADLDWLSYVFGPSAFLSWHRTYAHSIFGAIVIAAVLALVLILLGLSGLLVFGGFVLPLGSQAGKFPDDEMLTFARRERRKFFLVLPLAALCSAVLHLAMDLLQSRGIALFWPFRGTRVALDWLPSFDPWILAILLLAILLPELFLLVGSEIGAKAKRPRGRTGALFGLVLLFACVGFRAVQHDSAVATLQAATYANESPRRVAAFPDSLSLFTWHGVVETQSALHLVDVPLVPGSYFNPAGAATLHKPEDSPILQAAQATPAARQFLQFARFPKATVEHETTGYSVEIRDLPFAAIQQTLGAVEVNIDLDSSGSVTFAKLDWQKTLPRHN